MRSCADRTRRTGRPDLADRGRGARPARSAAESDVRRRREPTGRYGRSRIDVGTFVVVGEVPRRRRQALRVALDELVAGRRPEMLTWVRKYGRFGTELLRQPDEIWSHRWTDYAERSDGSAYGSLPLWTIDQSPSDLSVVFEIGADSSAQLTDLRVL